MIKDLEQNIRQFLSIINEDIFREGLANTPKRASKAWEEFLTPPPFKPTTFSANGYDQMIIESNIQYHTFCEHHLIPFFGRATIGYIPDKKIIGISKLPRTVEYFSKRLNTQEYFTESIAEFLMEKLQPKGLGVVIRGRHLCQEMRGIKKRGEMITSSLKGVMLTENTVRKEFLNLCQK